MSGEGVRRVLLLFGSEADEPQSPVPGSEATPLAGILSAIDAVPDLELELRIVSLGAARHFPEVAERIRLNDAHRAPIDRILSALGAFAIRERFASFPIGRLLNSIGPVAPSRVFWRALARDREAMQALRWADVVIAGDLETTKAAWIAVRRGWARDAFYDHRAVAVALALDS